MTATNADLVVRFADREVGWLRAGPSNTFTFTYGLSWLAFERSFPISLSLPLRPEAYVDGAAHTCFRNLQYRRGREGSRQVTIVLLLAPDLAVA